MDTAWSMLSRAKDTSLVSANTSLVSVETSLVSADISPMAESHKPPLARVPCYPWRTDLSGRATGHVLLVSIHGL